MAHLHILHNRFALVLALLLELWVGEALQQVAPWRSITRKSLTEICHAALLVYRMRQETPLSFMVFRQPVPAEVLKGQSLRDRELRWLGSGHLRLQSKAREKGKARQSSFHICPPPACCAAPGWPHHTDHRTGNLFAGKRCSERLQAFLRGHIFGWLFACWPRKQVNARAPTPCSISAVPQARDSQHQQRTATIQLLVVLQGYRT